VRRVRAAAVAVLALLIGLSGPLPIAAAAPEPPWPCLWAPVRAPIADGFRSPWCPWCRGNRGLEYAVLPGAAVRASAGGVVRFAGLVARIGYVVVEHPTGVRTTYGRVSDTVVAAGDPVVAGQILGRAAGSLLFFGVRPASGGPVAGRWGRPGAYLDPSRFLVRRIGRARLVPTDGSPARAAAGPSRLTCTARVAGR